MPQLSHDEYQDIFKSYYQKYSNLLQNSLMAEIAAELEALKQDDTRLDLSNYTILKQIQDFTHQDYGLAQGFIDRGLSPSAALQITYGAIWGDFDALENIEVPEDISDQDLDGIYQGVENLKNATAETFKQIENLNDQLSLQMAVCTCFLGYKLHRNEEIEKTYLFLNKYLPPQILALETEVTTYEQLTPLDIFSINHGCACFEQSEKATIYIPKAIKWLNTESKIQINY